MQSSRWERRSVWQSPDRATKEKEVEILSRWHSAKRAALVAHAATALVACGDGGGGGTDPTPPPPTPPPSSTPAAIALVSGGGQQAFSGDTLADPVVVVVTDAGGAPFAGATVRFAVSVGGGSVQPASQTTDANGQASARWRIGTGSGPQELAASVGQLDVRVSAVSAGDKVCNRTPVLAAALAAAAGRTECADVSAADLAGLVELDLTGPYTTSGRPGGLEISSLRRGDFHGLSRLESLVLAGNRLVGLPARVFDGASALLTLELNENLLTELESDAFAGLPSLAVLNLGSNRLTEVPSGDFAELPSLTTLDLGLNRIGALPADAFRSLSGLTSVLLTANQVEEVASGVFDSLSAATTLDLTRNRIETLPAGLLARMSSLENVYLSGNRLAQLPAGFFRGPSRLQRIDLAGNVFASLPPDLFAGLSDLRGLKLGGNLLESLPPGMFEGTGRLDELRLTPNPGSPFSLVVELERTDNQNQLAPGPAQVAAKLVQAAPFPMTVQLSASGGTAASATVDIPGGATISPSVEVVNTAGSSLSVLARPAAVPGNQCPDSRRCFEGFATTAGPALVLANPSSATATIPAVHLTQVTQNLAGGVPLVANRRALLRVFVRSDNANAFRPDARATFFRDGAVVHVATLEPPPAGVPTVVQEGLLGRSFNAEIPGSVLQPGTEMVVELDPNNAMPFTPQSTKRVPASGRTPLDIREVRPLNVTIVPVLYGWEANRATNAAVLEFARGLGAHNAEGLRFVRSLLPAAAVNVTVRAPYFTWADTTQAGGPGLLDEIELLRHLEAAGTDQYYHGIFATPRVIRPRGFWGFVGIAFVPGRSGLTASHEYDGTAYLAAAEVLAHELGHNLSLEHAPCGVGTGLDPDFPDPEGSTGTWGYDFGASGGVGRLLDPSKARDIMSYCLPAWAGSYSFEKALAHRVEMAPAGVGTGRGRSGAAGGAALRRTLIVWGGIRDGTPILEPAFAWRAPAKLPDKVGPYRVTGWDAAGREMFSLAFAPEEISDGARSFLFAIPFEASWSGVPERMVLSGPDGFATSDASASRRMAIFTDRATGRVRSLAREWSESLLSRSAPAFRQLQLHRPAAEPR